jgi:hypothetical protein
MRKNEHPRKISKTAILAGAALLVFMSCSLAQADSTPETEKIIAILNKECVHLKKDKLKDLLLPKLSNDLEKGFSPELLKIIEGVVKRTDFDNISEEKTAEIIGLVYTSFKKGASLEYLDQLFDVAYMRTISVDGLTAAAKALQEFQASDVPQDVAEEFVYHSLEDAWDSSAMPVLVRGLIYSVERGLTSQKVALIIMLDVRAGELKKKGPDQLVLDAIKLVREKEVKKWRPVKRAEKDFVSKQERKRKLEEMRQVAEAKQRQQEIDKKNAEETLRRMRAREADNASLAEQEKQALEIEAMLRAYRQQIMRYQTEQRALDADMAPYRAQRAREQLQRSREREELRKKQVDDLGRNITSYGKSGKLDLDKLYASIDRYMGVPYQYGGDSEMGIDCSAFTRRVYRTQNVELPRSSLEQSFVGFVVTDAVMQIGDLVFFDASITGRISHVGIYMGNGIFAHASSSTGVTKSSMREQYYMKRFIKAGRVFLL